MIRDERVITHSYILAGRFTIYDLFDKARGECKHSEASDRFPEERIGGGSSVRNMLVARYSSASTSGCNPERKSWR